MRTEPATLAGRSFDVLIVGGGINGAGLARDLALRGMKIRLAARSATIHPNPQVIAPELRSTSLGVERRALLRDRGP